MREEVEEVVDSRPYSRGGGGGMEEEILSSLGRSVGSKVTHAALIREKVSKGCVLCAHEKGDDDCF